MHCLRIVFYLLSTISISWSQTVPFTETAQDLGINYTFIPDIVSDYGLGISFIDINEDGFDDISFGGLQHENIHLYIYNDSLETFVEHTSSGINNLGYRSKCLLWADYDNDGDKDLSIVSIEGPPKLFQNLGNSTFQEVSDSAGITAIDMNAYAACWGDYNKDGWLDLYIINRNSSTSNNRNVLYKNLQDGTFEDVTNEAGVADLQGLGLAVSFIDYNNDSWPDIYIANDKYTSKNILFKNLGNGHFETISDSLTTGIRMDAMGLAIGDYNHNGFEDIYITNTPQSSIDFGGNVLLDNHGDGTFTDIAGDLNIRVFSSSWGASSVDINNDGHLDIYVSNDGPSDRDKTNSLFINSGNGTFILDTLSVVNSIHKRSYGNAVGDFNNDGFYDIAVMNILNDKVSLLKNESNTNHWIKVNLEGTISNKDGVGSWIKTFVEGNCTELYTRCGSSYGSQSSDNYIIGLGSTEKADSMIIIWPSGTVDTHYYLSSNKTYFFTEGVKFIDSSMIDTTTHLTFNTYNKSLFSIYPNPTFGQITIKANSSTKVTSIELINALGKTIERYYNEGNLSQIKTSFNINQYPTGNYFIKIKSSAGVFVERVVKIE